MSASTAGPWSLPSVLTVEGFTMRAWEPAHAEALAATLAASDAHLRAFTPWVVDGRVPGQSLHDRLAEHARRFAAGEEWVYGLFGDAGAVLGGCGLYPRIGPGAVELGYWLAAGQVGRGLATRSSAALVDLAFESLPVHDVEIRCDARNVASARVPARLGFTLARTQADGLQVWRLSRAAFDGAA